MKRIVRMGAVSVAMLVATAAQATVFNLVTLRSDGTPPSLYGDSSEPPAITPNGRYVAFSSSATNLVTPDAAGRQIYLRDRVAGTTELVSVNMTGGAGDNSSSAPSISDDGCRVVFTSLSSDLVAGDTASTNDVFVRDRCAQPPTTSFVSVSTGGAKGNARSIEGRISGDGSKVAFVSDATNLASATGAGFSCLFLRDLNAHVTTAITTAGGACIAGDGPDPSRDASRVAFWAQYVPGTSTRVNGVWQIYVHDFNAAPATQPVVVSTSAAGTPQTQGNEGVSTITMPAISSDGGYVAFRSRGAGLVAVDGGGFSHVYIKELATGTIVRASVDSSGNPGNGDSSGSGQGYRPGLARFANTVTFITSATNLAPETGGFAPNVVAHDPYTGRTVGFSADKTLSGLPNITDGGELIVAYSGYQLDPAYASRGLFVFAGMTARMFGISTRAQVLTADNVLIGGFIVSGSTPKTVVVNARGPSLTSQGVAGALANPILQVVAASNGAVITNDNWGTASYAAQLQSLGLAPPNALESSILATLNPGAYTAIVSGVGGATGVGIVEVFEVDHPESPLTGISTRGKVLTADNVMIGGFIIQGSSPQTVVVRARGPSLTSQGVAGALQNPVLQVVPADGSPQIVNDDWGTAANAAQLQSIGYAPTDSRESAVLVTLNPGAYTAIVSGAGGATGVAIIEVYAP